MQKAKNEMKTKRVTKENLLLAYILKKIFFSFFLDLVARIKFNF